MFKLFTVIKKYMLFKMVAYRLIFVLFAALPIVSSRLFICYYVPASYFPTSAVPSNICTHVIYAFGEIVNNGIAFRSVAEGTMVDNMVQRLKSENPNLKVSLSLQQGFPAMMASKSNRELFTSRAIPLLRKFGFDGIDFDWEFPHSSEKDLYSSFLQFFRESVEAEAKTTGKTPLLMSMALPNNKYLFSAGYDVNTINQNMDFFTIMAYDFHVFSSKDSKTGFNSPLYQVTGEASIYSVAGLLNYYLSVGLRPTKTIMGIPTYGRSYKLRNAQNNGIHAPAVSRGDPGPKRHAKGVYAYTDVCASIRNGAKVVRDPKSHGVYLYKGNNWVAYDDTTTVSEKTKWAINKNLGGVGIWAITLDDNSGVCKSKLPLMTAIRNTLNKFEKKSDEIISNQSKKLNLVEFFKIELDESQN